jgi:hypothetical protein
MHPTRPPRAHATHVGFTRATTTIDHHRCHSSSDSRAAAPCPHPTSTRARDPRGFHASHHDDRRHRCHSSSDSRAAAPCTPTRPLRAHATHVGSSEPPRRSSSSIHSSRDFLRPRHDVNIAFRSHSTSTRAPTWVSRGSRRRSLSSLPQVAGLPSRRADASRSHATSQPMWPRRFRARYRNARPLTVRRSRDVRATAP